MKDLLSELSVPKAFLLGLVLAGLYYVVFFDDGTSTQNIIRGVNSQIQSQQAELDKLKRSIQGVSEYQAKYQDLEGQMQLAKKVIPTDFRTSELMKILTNEAKSSGVEILNVSDVTKRTNTKEFLTSVSVKVSLEGNFNQLLVFLSSMTKIKKLITFDSLNLRETKSTQPGTQIKFDGTFSGYMMASDGTGVVQ